MDGKGLWISAEIMTDERLNLTEKFLLAEIQNLSQLGECFAGNEHFAQLLDLTKNRVSHLIANLKNYGLIAVDITYKAGTKEIEKRTITPIVIFNNTPSYSQQDPIVICDNTPIVENNKDKKQDIKKQIKKQSKEIYIGEFETLWSIYPNKKGKDQALKAYIKARTEKVEYETIQNGLQRYIKYVQIRQTEKQYIKHGSTFFNQRAWADDYDLTPNRPKGFFGLLYDEYQGEDIFEQDRGSENFGDFTQLLPEPSESPRRQNCGEHDSPNMGEYVFRRSI